MDGSEKTPWSGPKLEHRTAFLQQMEQLNERVRQDTSEPETPTDSEIVIEEDYPDKTRLITLIESENISEAFFLARRLVASGEEWAEEYLEQCRSLM